MWIKTRMYLLIAVLFGILYGVITGIGAWMGAGDAYTYLILAFGFLGIQYLISPNIVEWTMGVKYVTEAEQPELHHMVADLAKRAGLHKPKIGISKMNIPNAFAFGRTQGDGRICFTQGIMQLLSADELRAVAGHEISHIKHRDMAIITLLSAIPMIMYWIAMSFMWGGGDRKNGNSAALIGAGAFLLYFITNLLVLYGSRIREYYADEGSVKLGNQPHNLASSLYKLVYGDARFRGRQEMKKVESVRAFFLNDPSRSWQEVRELAQLDSNMDGAISFDELAELRQRNVKLSAGEKMMEIFTTHPNTLQRIKHLSKLIGHN